MSKGWSEERRERQAEAIRRHKPWEKSTGPKTAKGKRASSQNALKHGLYGAERETIVALLKANAEFLRLYKELQAFKVFEGFLEQTDRMFNEINDEAPRPPSKRGMK